jgi:hypothetical protein
MTGIEDKERIRLFNQDTILHQEADLILEKSGIGTILLKHDYHPVGSFVMKTMTWRDIDFERYDDEPDCDEHWELGKEIAQLDWVSTLHCNNAYRNPESSNESGYYWGIKVTEPESGTIWRIDLWTARREEFERASPNRSVWYQHLNDDTRFYILSIKDRLRDLPEMRRTYLSSHVYEAVLVNGVKNFSDFKAWWEKTFGKFEDAVPD